jgi:signal transduction histidine kinase
MAFAITPNMSHRGSNRGAAELFCIAIALLAIILLGVWGAYRDVSQARAIMLQLEARRVRSLAAFTVRQIEAQLAKEADARDFRSHAWVRWLKMQWRQLLRKQPERLYGAIIDRKGRIIVHTQTDHEGRTVSGQAYTRALPEIADDVVESRAPALTDGRKAFDVSLPIMLNKEVLATYHTGLDAEKFEQRFHLIYERILNAWTAVILSIVLGVASALLALYCRFHRATVLRQSLDVPSARHVSELKQIMVGLAREVRNPLNSIRLKLDVICRNYNGDEQISDDNWNNMVHDSLRDVERVDALVGEMLMRARGHHSKTIACVATRQNAP